MAGRKPTEINDMQALQRLVASNTAIVNVKPIVAFTMAKTGATYEQIGEVLGVTRQRAVAIVSTFEGKL